MEDRRKTQRRYLLYYTRIFDAVTRKQIGNLVDITPQGAMIVGDHPIPAGQTARLQMELTQDVADKPFIEFSACSRWCKPDFGVNMHNTGFEILDITPEDVRIVDRIVEEFGFRDNMPVN